MLSGRLEYVGAMTVWVAPPDTDELAGQGIKMWHRVKPDVSMVAFSSPCAAPRANGRAQTRSCARSKSSADAP